MPWGFNVVSKREKAEEMVRANMSLLLIVSPMCAAFSRLQRLNDPKMTQQMVREIMEYGVMHVGLCMRLCRIQHENGLYFLFEHPATVTSWDNRLVKKLLATPGVERVVGHMCMLDMKQKDQQGEGLIRKETGFMTNAPHIVLINGGAKAAEVYPDQLCRQIVMGVIEQMEEDQRIGKHMGRSIAGFERDSKEAEEYWDDLSGKRLKAELVRRAREQEMNEFRKHGVFEKVDIQQCWGSTGKEPIGTRWVDINKGDEDNSDYRSRLVAQEIKQDKREDLFAATPP